MNTDDPNTKLFLVQVNTSRMQTSPSPFRILDLFVKVNVSGFSDSVPDTRERYDLAKGLARDAAFDYVGAAFPGPDTHNVTVMDAVDHEGALEKTPPARVSKDATVWFSKREDLK